MESTMEINKSFEDSLFNSNDKIKFIIMDFEFTSIDIVDLLLTLGALASTLDKYKPVKLQGRPLVLTTNDKLRAFR
ncbi:Hypothetical protein CINCED_3A019183 [Cinara cedri]|uniref:Uncharacterized protein n=1 Tax=Cinara cedri TaxID=506608 RepID=A0A5E4NL90_9HEMI|nr:Hypothetical protein CINCED_3A019183 [Cinara cedri]